MSNDYQYNQSNYKNSSSYHNRHARQAKKRKAMRITLYVMLLGIIGALAVFSAGQYMTVRSLKSDLDALESRFEEIEEENQWLEKKYEEIYEKNREIIEENEKLREENKMMRSQTIIEHGNRDTNKVALTIDDGAGADLTQRALDYFKEYGVQATLFPKGDIVERQPEVWQRAVDEGHELGNHTYSHPFLSTYSDEGVARELSGWQEAVEESLGYPYRTLFFRPPYRDGYSSGQGHHRERIQDIVAEKGMFTILWDIELLYSLRNTAYTRENIANYVLENARGGSIVLLHFVEEDIAALPAIIEGLRERGLEPVTLSEVLLAEAQN